MIDIDGSDISVASAIYMLGKCVDYKTNKVPRKQKKKLKAEGEKHAKEKGIANAKITAIKRGFKIEVAGRLVYRQEQKFNYYK